LAPEAQITAVIAVHSTARPIARAVKSCLNVRDRDLVTVVVVCHNIAIEEIRTQLDDVDDDRICYLQLNDGLRSPAAPKNLGLRETTTPYVILVDSDDYLQDGALEQWHDNLRKKGAGGVIAPLQLQSGAVVRTPRARVGRRHALDAVKDQLAYATAPRGLWSTSLLRSIGFEYTEGLRTAEDLAPGLGLWFSGARFEYPEGPHYVLGEDAADRVTAEILPLDEEFQAVFRLGEQWWETLTPAARQSVATKLVRIHLLGALVRRGQDWPWDDADRTAVRRFIATARAMSATFGRPLSVAERTLIESVEGAGADSETYRAAIGQFNAAPYRDKLFGPGVASNLHRESTFRHQLRQKAHGILAWRP